MCPPQETTSIFLLLLSSDTKHSIASTRVKCKLFCTGVVQIATLAWWVWWRNIFLPYIGSCEDAVVNFLQVAAMRRCVATRSYIYCQFSETSTFPHHTHVRPTNHTQCANAIPRTTNNTDNLNVYVPIPNSYLHTSSRRKQRI